MSTETPSQPQTAGIWQTFNESPMAAKAIFAGAFVNRLGAFLSIFLVLFVASKGHSAAAAAATLGAYGIGGVVGTLIGGLLADRLGARISTVFSMSASAVLTVSLLYLPNYAVLFAVTALLGLVSQIFRPASATLLSELTPESRQVMIFAMYRFAVNMGTTASPLLGFALYNLGHKHYTLLFWGEGLVAVIYGTLALYALPRRERTPAETGRDRRQGQDRQLPGRAARPAVRAVPAGRVLQHHGVHAVPVHAAAGHREAGRGAALVHGGGGAERRDRDRLRTAADQDLPALAVEDLDRLGLPAGRLRHGQLRAADGPGGGGVRHPDLDHR